MTTNTIQLELDPRELMGKKVSRLRRVGIVPVHLYGPGMEPRSLQCQVSKLIRVLAQAGGATPITITIQGESGTHLAFARELQWDPRRDDLLHVDLLAADVNRPVTAQVPINLIGESPGAHAVNGTVMQQLRTLDVQALPLEMPGEIAINLEDLVDPNGTIRVSDIQLPDNITVLTDPETTIIRIEVARSGEAVEGEEASAGEAPSASAEGESSD